MPVRHRACCSPDSADDQRALMLIDVLDSSALRATAYVIVAIAAVVTGLWERRMTDRDSTAIWPTYWFLSAALMLAMAVARSSGFGDLVSDIGRDQARSSGWYDARRGLQVVAVVAVSITWLVAVFVSIWRVPPRRRRYLPTAIALGTIVAFAAVRVVSLHHVDTVLYRRDIGGVRIVAVMELSLLCLTLATMAWSTRRATGPPLASALTEPATTEPRH